mmetsp:Transcript_116564/g.249257  ORF Transcript_116564/g.249257 Transcript_116564/m.249257 type:complete len:253 (-) Transcript_116564:83-841(-)
MGPKQSRISECTPAKNSFKLFEYKCPSCNAKRPIQFFHRKGTFLQQSPRVVCGACNTSVTVEPFKTVEYECPACKKWQKARLPARPIPLNMYNVSVVNCNCGFRGEVTVGKVMNVACTSCWQHKRELCDVWAEDGDDIKSFCVDCQDYQHCFARSPRRHNAEQQGAAEMEYTCEGCFRVRPIHAEELLRREGLACCDLCNWTGYPEVVPKGQSEKPRKQRSDRSAKGQSSKRHAEKAKLKATGVVPGGVLSD